MRQRAQLKLSNCTSAKVFIAISFPCSQIEVKHSLNELQVQYPLILRKFNKFVSQTLLTIFPCGPVCLVTSICPSICPAKYHSSKNWNRLAHFHIYYRNGIIQKIFFTTYKSIVTEKDIFIIHPI